MKVTLFKGHGDEYEPSAKIIASRLQESCGFQVDLESGCLCDHPPRIISDIVILHPHSYRTSKDETLEKDCLEICAESIKMNPDTHFYVLALNRKTERERVIGKLPNVTYSEANEVIYLWNQPASFFQSEKAKRENSKKI